MPCTVATAGPRQAVCRGAAKSKGQKLRMRTDDVRLPRFVRVLHVYGYRARPTFHGIHFIFLHSEEHLLGKLCVRHAPAIAKRAHLPLPLQLLLR